ncbi:DUF4124 domain-containing protein [Halioxenophilus sp. WMMB6]|uniref:DUF4124 domain-containing protein n=1 Tax=Halioxenophilus sp. WMMB6 TaxID=3073815 RepID=UPI00295E231A|nr:DUF4124 domain-containing protein [Halioxenophilus sp. WMMB6]
MNVRAMLATCAVVLAAMPGYLNAQIYRWVDDNGKVHYSDRKPETNRADDVSDDLGTINVTASEPVQARGRDLPETEAERAVRESEEREAQKASAAKQKQCAIARDSLRKISGPVYFERPDGSTYEITEEERAEREGQLRQAIDRYCQ